jgi:biopolymer transport protein ExbD
MANFSTNDKKAPSVDMTPMVDLGFLLITFFMLASSFSKGKIINIISPAQTELTTDMKCSKSLTLLLDEKDKLKYYTCPENGQVDSLVFSNKALRQLIVNRQNQVASQWGDKNKLFILLKSHPRASYKNLVDAIDEMRITEAQFTICTLDKTDSSLFQLGIR